MTERKEKNGERCIMGMFIICGVRYYGGRVLGM
jgi:hypothetical protein